MDPLQFDLKDPDDVKKMMVIASSARYQMTLFFKPHPKTGKIMVNALFNHATTTDEFIEYLDAARDHVVRMKNDVLRRRKELEKQSKKH